MRKFIYLAFLLLIISSCGDKTPVVGRIDLENAFEIEKEKLYIQDLFSQVDYLPLETTDSSLLGAKPRIVASDTAFLLSAPDMSVRLFSRKSGRFIRNIGHCGDDPQGYALNSNFKCVDYWLDQTRGVIYFRGWRDDFQLYDLQGNYMGKMQYNRKTAHVTI